MTYQEILQNPEILAYYEKGDRIFDAQFSLKVNGQKVL